MRLLLVLSSGMLLMLGITGSSAFAAKPGAGTCSGGAPGFGNAVAIPAGTYAGFAVTGYCYFGPGTMTINGNLTIADGAQLNDHASGEATVHISGNVQVGKGAVLGLGDYNPFGGHTSAIVDGNVNAHNPTALYLGDMTIRGNLVSNGGSGPGRNFPTKDNTIGGNLIIQGWTGTWIGLVRNQVGGNVNFSKNTAMDTSEPPGSDSSEVQTNAIAGNLICHGNTPTAQVNLFDGGEPNEIGGNAVGECPPRIVDNPTE
jgi:hypothetical protein